jgi:sterol desaturase/sphingolipid hydroxylase (fatty acid hydroxylase superfamily)
MLSILKKFWSELRKQHSNVVLVPNTNSPQRDLTWSKENIFPGPKKELTILDFFYFVSSTLLQTGTEIIVQQNFIGTAVTNIFFVIKLFIFEVLLDLFHYTFHYIEHRWYYRFHKIHHYHNHPRIINTYYQHPVDLILVDCVPTVLSFYLMKGYFNKFQMYLVFVYKSFIEISGHSGKHLSASCFPLCVWLPRALGIELYTIDHDLHHSTSIVNFSKRFKLWDIVFGTFN